MARHIPINSTIIDYINVLEELNVMTNQPTNVILLNQFEWNQMLALLKSNYKDCAEVITFNECNTTMMYKDIVVAYDGGEDQDSSYMYHIGQIHEEMERIRRQAAGEARPQELTGTGRIRAGNGSNRPRVNRSTYMDLEARLTQPQAAPTATTGWTLTTTTI